MATTHYVMGTVCGPHPFPHMVTYFQSLIGREARQQILELTGTLPQRVYACVGGGSNASAPLACAVDWVEPPDAGAISTKCSSTSC